MRTTLDRLHLCRQGKDTGGEGNLKLSSSHQLEVHIVSRTVTHFGSRTGTQPLQPKSTTQIRSYGRLGVDVGTVNAKINGIDCNGFGSRNFRWFMLIMG